MIPFDVLKSRLIAMQGQDVTLLEARGLGRLVKVDESGADVVVRGVRIRLTWGRLDGCLQRLAANHTLTVEELGGGPDALGLVSLLAAALPEEVVVSPAEGLILARERNDKPIHQYANMSGVVRGGRPRRRA